MGKYEFMKFVDKCRIVNTLNPAEAKAAEKIFNMDMLTQKHMAEEQDAGTHRTAFGVDRNQDENSLVRYQFIECLFALALEKYNDDYFGSLQKELSGAGRMETRKPAAAAAGGTTRPQGRPKGSEERERMEAMCANFAQLCKEHIVPYSPHKLEMLVLDLMGDTQVQGLIQRNYTHLVLVYFHYAAGFGNALESGPSEKAAKKIAQIREMVADHTGNTVCYFYRQHTCNSFPVPVHMFCLCFISRDKTCAHPLQVRALHWSGQAAEHTTMNLSEFTQLMLNAGLMGGGKNQTQEQKFRQKYKHVAEVHVARKMLTIKEHMRRDVERTVGKDVRGEDQKKMAREHDR
jgi:hypothetical protein